MSILSDNLDALKRHQPALFRMLEEYPRKSDVAVFRARDGGVAYGLRSGGKIGPVSDPVAPVKRLQSQFDRYARQISDFTRPVFVLGLYPGNELLRIFDLSEKQPGPHCPQPLWVCVDSPAALYGFLSVWDARQAIASPRVRWFRSEETGEQIAFLRAHPEFPHVATLISGAPDAVVDRVMAPFAGLVMEREEETRRLQAENDGYYDAISDPELAEVIAGKAGRKPRLLMPTCAWSTYIQYSVRDTCAAFEQMGWETMILKLEAMLTPYYLVKSVRDFRPDVFLFIDHLRSEAEGAYPRNMMFVTWVQDEMPNLHCKQAGDKLREYAARGKRDLVVGYVGELETKYGFPKDRLAPLNIPADPRIFRPVALSECERAKYGCVLAFMSNTSMSSEQVIEKRILPLVEPLGISAAACGAIHDGLWKLYRDGKTLALRRDFLAWLMENPEFAGAYNRLDEGAPSADGAGNPAAAPAAGGAAMTRDDLFRLFFWRLNDTIYRHVVLEWADELGADMRLYGLGWENHPRFGKYARGALEHGPELNLAYRAAKANLHLNIAGGMHQRIWEIFSAGAGLLMRAERRANPNEPRPEVMRRLAEAFMGRASAGLASAIEEALSGDGADGVADWVFNIALSAARAENAEAGAGAGASGLQDKVLKKIETALSSRPDWLIPDWDRHVFFDRESFASKLREM